MASHPNESTKQIARLRKSIFGDESPPYESSDNEKTQNEKCKLDETSVGTNKSHTKEQIKCHIPLRMCDSLPNNIIKTTKAIRVDHKAVKNQEETERKTDVGTSSSVKTMPKQT